MLDPTTAERIRAIFLHANERVTIEDAAALLGRTEADILAAIEAGDIEWSCAWRRAIHTAGNAWLPTSSP